MRFLAPSSDAVIFLLQVNVNVAAKGDVHFILVYEELLGRKFGRYKQVSLIIGHLTIHLCQHI